MEVHILSRKLITPSKTNDHPRRVEISCIDQLAPQAYTDCIFYYASTKNEDENVQRGRIESMEKSLSETLTLFYLLAGRFDVNDRSMIECNDEGAELLEARVKGRLDEVVAQDSPDSEALCGLVPPTPRRSSSGPLLLIQVNVFECGGVAVGVLMSHIVADMYTFTLFTTQWAKVCRSGNVDQTVRPSFSLSSIFPPHTGPNPPGRLKMPSRRGIKVVTTRFVFDGKTISRLRANYSQPQRPTRVQLVTAILWRALIKAHQARRKAQQPRPSSLYHSLNLRNKTSLPVPNHSCGNLTRLLHVPNGEPKTKLEGLVGLVRGALTDGAAESAKPTIRAEDVVLLSEKALAELMEARGVGEEDVFAFASWCRMGVYQVDFGWGEADWVSIVRFPVEGYVVLLDTKDGDGIEAWVSLGEDDMSVFQLDRHIV